MKFICTIIFAVALIFMGCSTTYVASKFDSKDEFNKQFNNDAKDEVLTVDIKRDSSQTSTFSNEYGQIQNDTLTLSKVETTIIRKEIPANQIKSIAYKNGNIDSAYLIMKNGEIKDVENFEMQPDRLVYSIKKEKTIQNNIPINSINKINFKSNSGGTVRGILAGMGVGLLIAYTKIIHAYNDQIVPPGEKPQNYNFEGVAIISIPLGGLIGGIVGRLLGYKYTYEFNP